MMVFGLGEQKPQGVKRWSGRAAGRAAIARAWTPILWLALAGSIPLVRAQAPVDAAFERFWAARTPAEAAVAARAVTESGANFAQVVARLKQGRAYSAQAPRGIVRLSHRTAAGEFVYTLDVPETYHPGRRYQVRVHLHGGVSRPEGTVRGSGAIGALAGAEQIYVIPYAWRDAPWWSEAQLQNLRAILDAVKRTYNVDENRVVVSGVSDGGTGAYYIAMRDTTPFASFLPLNGFIMVLASESLGIREELFPNGLRNKAFFVVNGGRDPLYPAALVEPYVRHLQRGGVTLDYEPQPDAGHNTAWWPQVKDAFEDFVRSHPRDPVPAALTWETDLTEGTNRAHWLVIDRLTAPAGPNPLPDLNDFVGERARPGGGTPRTVPIARPLFPRSRPSGRVDLVREGNTIRATTRGVAELTLLISPDAFDLARPITVVADGRPVFAGRVEPSVATLMKWAARDNDRTMLFGGEIRVSLVP